MSDYKIAIKIAGQLEKSFSGAIKGAQAGLKALSGMGKLGAAAMTGAGAAIGAVAIASVNTGREFEAAMSSTAATAGASQEEFNKLREAAMQMGRETSKTATESANALEYMALAGWSVDQSIQGLPSVLRLSEATGLDLARTSDLVTDSMSATGQTVDDLSGYLDICARAQNKSNQTAEQLMEAYIGVGGTMKGLNVPVQESATALGVLANRGIKGSEAGNALNAIMVNLTTGTGQAGKMMESLGVSAFDSEGKFIGLQATLQQLNGKLSGLTEEQRNAALAAIGGKQHVDALNDLMSGLNTTTADGVTEWEALENQLYNANGALETMAETKLDNLNGDLSIFQSALQDCGIKIYDNLQEPLRGATQFGTQMVYQLSDALKAGGFDGFVAEFGNVFAQVIVKAAEYAPQFINVASNMVMSFLSGIQSNSGTIASGATQMILAFIQGLIMIVPQILMVGLQLIAQLLAGIAQGLPQITSVSSSAVNQFVSGILQNTGSIISSGIQIIMTLLSALISAAPAIMQGGLQLIAQLIMGIAQAIPALIPMGIQLIMGLLQGFVSGMGSVGEAVGNLVTSIIEVIFTTDWLQVGWDIIKALASGIWEGIKGVGKGIWEGIKGWFSGDDTGELEIEGQSMAQSYANGVTSGISEAQAGAASTSAAAASGLNAGTQEAGLYGQNLVSSYSGGIAAGGQTATIAANTTANNTLQAFNVNTGVANNAGLLATNAYSQGLTSGTAEATTAANLLGSTSLDTLNNTLATGAGSLNLNAAQLGTQATAGLQNGITTGMTGVTAAAQNSGVETINAMSQSISQGATQIQTTIEQLTQTITTSLNNCWSEAGTQATTAWTGINTQIQTELTGINTGVQTSMTAIQTTMSTGWVNLSTGAVMAFTGLTATVNASMTGLQVAVSAGMMVCTMSVTAGGASMVAIITAAAANITATVSSASANTGSIVTAGTVICVAVVKNGMVQLVAAVVSGGAVAVSSAESSAQGIYAAFAAVSLYAAGVNMMAGLISGINSMRGSVMAAAASVAQAAAAAVNNALQIHSPSRVLIQSGQYAGAGLVTGLENMRGSVQAAAQSSLAAPVRQGAEVRKIEAPNFGARSSVIHDTINYFQGDKERKQSGGQGQKETFVYSPVYHFEGAAPSKDDLIAANKMSQAEFEKMMKEYQRKKGRTAFA